MSKELTPLEAFNNILKMSIGLYKEDIEVVEKSLKALEIIKEKGCLQFCMLGVSLEDYNKSVDSVNKYKYSGMENYKHYTQEEFDLLKEVLK